MTFGRWRQLLAAMERLARGERVLDVALDLGYESPSAFAAMFRKAWASRPAPSRRAGGVRLRIAGPARASGRKRREPGLKSARIWRVGPSGHVPRRAGAEPAYYLAFRPPANRLRKIMPHYRSRTSTHGRNMAGARALARHRHEGRRLRQADHRGGQLLHAVRAGPRAPARPGRAGRQKSRPPAASPRNSTPSPWMTASPWVTAACCIRCRRAS